MAGDSSPYCIQVKGVAMVMLCSTVADLYLDVHQLSFVNSRISDNDASCE